MQKGLFTLQGLRRRRGETWEMEWALQGLVVQALGAAGPPQGSRTGQQGSFPPGIRAPPWGWLRAKARPGHLPMGGSGSVGPTARQGSVAGSWRLALLRHSWDRD